MLKRIAAFFFATWLALPALGITLNQAFTETLAGDDLCNPGPKATAFLTTDSNVWTYVSVTGALAGDKLQAAWVRPDGVVYTVTDYTGLPAAGDYCFNFALVSPDSRRL